MNEAKDVKLVAALSAFAEENGLSSSELETLLGNLVLNDLKLKKGGVGAIASDVFAILDGRQNALAIGDKRWEGREATQSELVVIDGNGVAAAVPIERSAALKIVIFESSAVRYIDLSTNKAGRYSRDHFR